MKLNKFFMGISGALALTACSSDDIISDLPSGEPTESSSRFMTVRIRNVDSSTRAGGDQTNGFEEGLDYENAVSSVRFYFFNEKGDPYIVSYTGLNYFDCKEITVSKDENDGPIINMPNEEKQLEAMIVLTSTDPSENFSGIKAMAAVVNNHLISDNLGIKNMSLSELKAVTGDYRIINLNTGSNKGQFVMTSSSFGASPKDGKTLDYGCETEVDASRHIKNTSEEALASPVEIFVERLVAKVRVTADWKSEMNPKKVKFNGQEYAAIPLKSKVNGTISPITIKVNENGSEAEKQIYLLFNGWDLSATVDESYLFKKVNTEANWNFGWDWNAPTNHRSYWATNTPKFSTAADASNAKNFIIHKHKDAQNNKVGSKLYDPSNSSHITYDGTSLYCLENAGEVFDNGSKPAYDPDVTTRNRTVAYISGKLVILDDERVSVPNATEITYAEWGGENYTENDLVKAMFRPSQNTLYVREAKPYKTDYRKDEDGNVFINPSTNEPEIIKEYYNYPAISVANVELVSAEAAGKADNDSENSKRYLSFIILKDQINVEDKVLEKVSEAAGADVKLYKKIGSNDQGDQFEPISRENANDFLTSVPGAKVWRNGDVYYYTDLRHLGADGQTGLYGVVRNHIYEVVINSVYGLGTPVLNPNDGEGFEDFPIDPQKPGTDAYYLGARINILSWRVVPNNVDLEW